MRFSCLIHGGRRFLTGAIIALIMVCMTQSSGAADKAVNKWDGPNAKYVFMFIGDGMGLQQISAAEAYLAAMQKTMPGIVKLSFSKFADQGLCTTYSANSFITDSAPAGTALASGYKTDNGVIGLGPDKATNLPTIAENAKQNGMRVGIVSTVSLNHATPASYYAHTPSRGSYYKIGQQLIDSGFDYFAGGGLHKAEDRGRQNLYLLAAGKGFKVLRTREKILAATQEDVPVLAVNANLDADSAMPYALDKSDSDVSLAEFVQKGIELLAGDKGFFMMVEGGKIDWACHANDAATCIHDTLDFDAAVRVAGEFAARHPAETLIVVTGDHETGGMGLGFAGTEYTSFFDKLDNQKISFQTFDRKIAELRADKGTKAKLADIQDYITDNFGLLFLSDIEIASLKQNKTDEAAQKSLGLALNTKELKMLEQAFALSMSGSKVKVPDTQEFILYGGHEPLSIQITHILNNKAGIGWTSYAHTGIPVPVFAGGQGSELFRGYYDNTDVVRKIYSIMGLEPQRPTRIQAAR